MDKVLLWVKATTYGFQNYLIFHPLFNTQIVNNLHFVKATFWRSVGTSKERNESLHINVAPEINYSNEGKTSIKIDNSVLIQENLTFIYKKW